MAGPTNAKKYKDAIFLAGSASAEFLADMALVPVRYLQQALRTMKLVLMSMGILL